MSDTTPSTEGFDWNAHLPRDRREIFKYILAGLFFLATGLLGAYYFVFDRGEKSASEHYKERIETYKLIHDSKILNLLKNLSEISDSLSKDISVHSNNERLSAQNEQLIENFRFLQRIIKDKNTDMINSDQFIKNLETQLKIYSGDTSIIFLKNDETYRFTESIAMRIESINNNFARVFFMNTFKIINFGEIIHYKNQEKNCHILFGTKNSTNRSVELEIQCR